LRPDPKPISATTPHALGMILSRMRAKVRIEHPPWMKYGAMRL
jgi:hypothetical protein